ncbi:MAG TPA: nitrite reductase large subunit NirB [Polyangia bacterium]|nr:nitrite reductase large subunit NirB [Polyangia bacterium]
MATKLVIVGNGMVGHRLVELCTTGDNAGQFDITVVGEERRAAYDRVNLTKFFDGGADGLTLATPDAYDAAGVRLLLGDAVASIDRAAGRVRTAAGVELPYDKLILATGSSPFVPPVEGRDAAGCFVYRTIEDLEGVTAAAESAGVGVVIGGGLLGLEAANALRKLGLETHVIEIAPRLMALQVDDAGGAILRRHIESLGVAVHVGVSAKKVLTDEAGQMVGLQLSDGGQLDASLVVFSAGIRPRDELARAAGLAVARRGGIEVDERCRSSDPDILAIGECAAWDGRCYGLVAPGYTMAQVAADELAGVAGRRLGHFDMSTKLKLMGVDVASFGDAFGLEGGAHTLRLIDNVAGVYKQLVVSADRQRLLGGILVGDASQYSQLLAMVQSKAALPMKVESLLVPPGDAPAGLGVDALPASATICSCNNVEKGAICSAIAGGAQAVGAIKSCTKAGTTCGSCVPLLNDLLKIELKKIGVAVNNALCEHFSCSRQDLYQLVRLHKIKTFDELLARHGRGQGCEICKPAVGSILASAWNEPVLERKHRPLQDTNDRFLANIQRDGTYSVIPRVAAGEITPEQLVTIGDIARKYGLYTKITGAQRIDMLGARLEQLPLIWRELVDAGFESGHAYGKALRTVKSCVGETWCRYGVQDSVGLAVRLENRYKGLRSPHKLKSAVSGCARECAEAQGKDFGIIATEKGWNLYVCGNGGMKPQHAQLLATDLDEATLVKYIDRFLMFYVRTADRLQRTAGWLNNLEGGIGYLREVVVEDKLGIAAELEAEMAHVVGTYRCEWKDALEDPQKLAQFRSFVNSPAPDPSLVFIRERGQPRPAHPHEKRELLDHLTQSPRKKEAA